MERYVLKKVSVILVCACLFAGCSKMGTFLHVAEGARAYASGDYQKANISYIEAGRSDEYEEWVAYDLGAVYYALGEVDAAESEWQIAQQPNIRNSHTVFISTLGSCFMNEVCTPRPMKSSETPWRSILPGLRQRSIWSLRSRKWR